ncbi:MAG: 4Fe-4S cluster-binding domain-containing protein [Acidaminococcaceae bacterium]|nr:4Fe-4S cluster-binding domain-containing protein [Acidaminococcaceae bacterium]
MTDLQVVEKTIMLIIVECCNLNCSYCYEFHKSDSKMDFYTAKRVLDHELTDTKYERFMIQLFGGEPFINFELIQQIDAYLLEYYSDIKYHIFIPTNGTLFTPAIKDWLVERKQRITVGLSLDGTKSMHDTNRSKSFDSIDLQFFLVHYPQQACKMTISNETIPYMAEGIIYLTELGFKVLASFAEGIVYNPATAQVVVKQFQKLVDFYLKHPQYTVCNLLDENIHLIGHNDESMEKWCGCGKHLIAYDSVGDKYPCQLFSPISLGDRACQFKNKDEEFIAKLGDFRDAVCKDCLFKAICPSCCGMNWLTKNNLAVRDETVCLFTKIRFYFTAYYLYKKFFSERKTNEKLNQHEYAVLIGIQKVIAYFENDPVGSQIIHI